MESRVKKEVPDPRRLFAVREKQSWAASMINRHFGPFKKSHPELWVQRTFMLIVLKLYERLVLGDAISCKEFAELTKTLVDGSKNELTEGAGKQAASDRNSNLDGVVTGLENMVRQIYGTNLQTAEPGALPSSMPITPGLEAGT